MTLYDKMTKTEATRVLGIDASTNSIAFALMEGKELAKYGIVNVRGGTIFDKVLHAKQMAQIVKKIVGDYDYVCVEGAVNVKSIAVAIKLAYVFGAIIAEFKESGAEVVTATPIQWQSYIGNKNWTKDRKEALKAELPGHSVTWYSGEVRRRRKAYTIDYFNNMFDVDISDDNVSDSVGLAWYAVNNLVR